MLSHILFFLFGAGGQVFFSILRSLNFWKSVHLAWNAVSTLELVTHLGRTLSIYMILRLWKTISDLYKIFWDANSIQESTFVRGGRSFFTILCLEVYLISDCIREVTRYGLKRKYLLASWSRIRRDLETSTDHVMKIF
jgi:hypothetical protein